MSMCVLDIYKQNHKRYHVTPFSLAIIRDNNNNNNNSKCWQRYREKDTTSQTFGENVSYIAIIENSVCNSCNSTSSNIPKHGDSIKIQKFHYLAYIHKS
jgi:hypothetical protein